jgi:HEAT repeat protein
MELSVSVKHHGPPVVPYLLDGLKARDMSIVELCIELLAEVGFVDGVQTLREMAASYPNVAIRAKAVQALGRLGDGRSEALLIEYLSNPFPQLRSRSLEALRSIGTVAAVPTLTQRLVDGPLVEKIAAARALAAAGGSGRAILRSFGTGPVGRLRDVALQVLEEVGEETVV